MTDIIGTGERPRRILLATDLSSRGDRALDRSLQLAHEWGAELHVVHALDAPAQVVPLGVDAARYLRGCPDPRMDARRQLERLAGDRARLHVEDAPATAAILAVAEREGCGLVVLGESRNPLLGPIESTLDGVVRKAAASVLIVRGRPAGPYRRLLVGTDYSDEALQALQRAGDLFPAAAIRLVHAYAMPYAALVGDTPSDPGWKAAQLSKLRAHVASAELPASRADAIGLQVEAGTPAAVLKQCALETDAELTVIGAHARGLLFDAVIGSSRQIIDAIAGDVLVVRAARRGG